MYNFVCVVVCVCVVCARVCARVRVVVVRAGAVRQSLVTAYEKHTLHGKKQVLEHISEEEWRLIRDTKIQASGSFCVLFLFFLFFLFF